MGGEKVGGGGEVVEGRGKEIRWCLRPDCLKSVKTAVTYRV